MSALFIAAPAMFALLLKAGIFVYARLSGTHSKQTQLYLLFLFCLSIQNLGEIHHFYDIAAGEIPAFALDIFYLGSIGAIAFSFHLANSLVFPESVLLDRISRGVYVFAALLAILFLATDLFRQGYQLIGYSATRIPGPWYWIFELYAIGLVLWYFGAFLYAALTEKQSEKRSRHWLMWFAFVPIVAVVVIILSFLHFGITGVNATVLLPFAITFFLVVTAYAIHSHRIFDVRFFVPWSRTRREKQQLHRDLRQCIRSLEQSHPGNIQELIDRLSQTLAAPVAIVSTRRSFRASSADSELSRFPVDSLRQIYDIVMTADIADARPDLHCQMSKCECGVIVPLMIEGRSARGWLLIGERISDRIYTPADHKTLTQLLISVKNLFSTGLVSEPYSLQDEVREIECELIKHALARTQGNQARAARWLGIPPSTLHFKLERYGIREYLDSQDAGLPVDMKVLKGV